MWAGNASDKISLTKGKLYEPVKLCTARSYTASWYQIHTILKGGLRTPD